LISDESKLVTNTSLLEDLEDAFKRHDSEERVRLTQLEQITQIQLSKNLNDNFYNDVIDRCNESDE